MFEELDLTYVILALVLVVAGYLYWKNQQQPPKRDTLQSPKIPIPVKKPIKPKVESNLTGPPVKIFFGSQTGTAEDFSRTLDGEAKRYTFNSEVVDLEDYPVDELANEKFVIFMVATYGEGEPTDNAREFFEWLMDSSREPGLFKGVEYTVFGLGNKTYEHFNAIARAIDTRMEELGAKRIFKKGEGDDDGSLEEDFSAWKKELWPALCKHFSMNVKISENELHQARFNIKYHLSDSNDAKAAANAKNLFKRPPKGQERVYEHKNPYIAKVLVNRELHTPLSDRSCRHIELDIGNELTYEPGDHIGVYAENDAELVEAVAARLGVDLAATFSLYNAEAKGPAKPLIGPCTVRMALAQWCDLTSPPRKSLIKVLAQFASDEKDKQSLLELADEDKHQPYTQKIKDECRIILEILNEHPSVKIPFEIFLDIVPRLAPRYYSISSSMRDNPGRVHITAVVVNFKTPIGRVHKGVCTHYFLRQPSELAVYIRRSIFHLPKDVNTPLLMVGPGTGLAPFRGFIQERIYNTTKEKKTCGDSLLFFGCRSEKIDFIYKEELLAAHNAGHIKLFVAFSRDDVKKVYVQHKIEENAKLVWELLDKKRAFFYICGDAKNMASDVRHALKNVIVNEGGMTGDEAEQYLVKLGKENRYHTDLW